MSYADCCLEKGSSRKCKIWSTFFTVYYHLDIVHPTLIKAHHTTEPIKCYGLEHIASDKGWGHQARDCYVGGYMDIVFCNCVTALSSYWVGGGQGHGHVRVFSLSVTRWRCS